MTSAIGKLPSTLRSFLGKLVVLFTMLYVLAITCSMAAMEITAWATFTFLLLYLLVDRMTETPTVELHTLGAEFPLLTLVIVVICGLLINAPTGDFVFAVGSLRNLALLFVFAYALQIVKNLNGVMALLASSTTLVSIYAIWQHFSGVDLWRHDNRALVQVAWGKDIVYQSVGFFSHHLTYGHSYMMALCLPWAALLLSQRSKWWHVLLAAISFSTLLVSLVFTYGRGVWIAIAVGLPLMAFFASRKLFFVALAILAVSGGVLYQVNPVFHERAISVFAENYQSNDDRKKLWQANMEMFHDHPWIGVGYRQNEPLSEVYFKKLGIQDGMAGHAHSNYVELLATTGIIGFASYMIFILAFVLMTARLFATIPTTHHWHRVFALAALGAQISFHVGGLTQWNFGDAEVQHQFLFWLALVAYMSQRYYAHIVPDDRSI